MTMQNDEMMLEVAKLMRGPALAAFAANLKGLVQIMQRVGDSVEDKLIRASAAYIVAELHLRAEEKHEDSSAGVAGGPDAAGSGA